MSQESTPSTPSTQIRLSPQGALELVLPDGRGGERLLALPVGEAEGALRRILRAQKGRPAIGREGPATYTYQLHLARHSGAPHPNCIHCQDEAALGDFFAKGGEVRVVAPGSQSAPKITTTASPEELGL